MKTQKIKKSLLLIALSLIFTWGFNLWNDDQNVKILNPYTQQFETVADWQMDSESLIWGRVLAAQHEGLFSDAGLLRRWTWDTDDELFLADEMPQDEPTIYMSSSGLQGTVIALFAVLGRALHISNSVIYRLLSVLNTAAFVAVLLLFCRWLYQEVGWLAAIAAFLGMFSYPWVAVSVRNLYWITWSLLLPTVITARWAQAAEQGKRSRGGVYLFIAALLRFMCGFEFVSTIMLSAEIPVLYYLLRDWADKAARRRWLRLGVLAGLLQLGAFAGAVLLWMAQLAFYHGDLQAALATMKYTVARRTGLVHSDIPLEQQFLGSLELPRTEVVKMYLFGEPMWGRFSVRAVLLAVFGVTIVNGRLARQPWQKTAREVLFLGACALPPLSWFFLGAAHSDAHRHINFLLWGFPFLPLVTGFMVQRCVEVFHRLWERDPLPRIRT